MLLVLVSPRATKDPEALLSSIISRLDTTVRATRDDRAVWEDQAQGKNRSRLRGDRGALLVRRDLGDDGVVRFEKVWGRIEMIVLDAVGTLIEPWPSVAEAYARVALKQGVSMTKEDVQARFRTAFQRDDQVENPESLVTDEATEVERWRGIVRSVLPGLPDPDRAFADLWKNFGSPSAWRCYPDVADALDRFGRHGLRLAIASNFDSRLEAVVRGLPDLARHAPTLVISSQVGFKKPHPAFYEKLCELVELSQDRLLMVGDDLKNDVEAARLAGLQSIWLDRSGRSVSGDSDRVPNLDELATDFESWRGNSRLI